MVEDGHQHATNAPTAAAELELTAVEQPPKVRELARGNSLAQSVALEGAPPMEPATSASGDGGSGQLERTKRTKRHHTRRSMEESQPTGVQSSSGSLVAPPAGQRSSNNSSRDEAEKPHREHYAANFPSSKKWLSKAPLIRQMRFHWDQTEQGHVLGAFFYGYILFQIPGARMAESVGARWILMAATAGSALISLIFPLSTQLNSIHLLMVLRFVMGLCQSAFFPAAYVFFCRWLPENERSVLLPIMFIGSNMGSISTYILSSYLISSAYGWPSVFYVSGLICLLVSLCWLIIGSNGPHDNWLITDEERDYIIESVNASQSSSPERNEPSRILGPHTIAGLKERGQREPLGTTIALAATNSNKSAGQPTKHLAKSRSANDLIASSSFVQQHQQQQRQLLNKNAQKLATIIDLEQQRGHNLPKSIQGHPNQGSSGESELCWSKLLRSVPIWTLILSMYGNEWSQVVLTYELPTYLNTALNFPIEQNGVINSFFQLSFTLTSPVVSSLGAYLLRRQFFNMRKIHVRKLFQSMATFGQLACFISVPICGANRGLIIMFMFSATVFKSCANAGDIMVPGDLSPEFAGTIFAFANSIGNTAGFAVPLFAGMIVEDAYEREQWTPFWLTSATIMCFSGLIFLTFGKTDRQNFSKEPALTNGHELRLGRISAGARREARPASPKRCKAHGRRL